MYDMSDRRPSALAVELVHPVFWMTSNASCGSLAMRHGSSSIDLSTASVSIVGPKTIIVYAMHCEHVLPAIELTEAPCCFVQPPRDCRHPVLRERAPVHVPVRPFGSRHQYAFGGGSLLSWSLRSHALLKQFNVVRAGRSSAHSSALISIEEEVEEKSRDRPTVATARLPMMPRRRPTRRRPDPRRKVFHEHSLFAHCEGLILRFLGPGNLILSRRRYHIALIRLRRAEHRAVRFASP